MPLWELTCARSTTRRLLSGRSGCRRDEGMSIMSSEANVESIIAQHFNGSSALNAEREAVQSRDRKFIEAVGRGIAILEAFERSTGTLGNGELHHATGF